MKEFVVGFLQSTRTRLLVAGKNDILENGQAWLLSGQRRLNRKMAGTISEDETYRDPTWSTYIIIVLVPWMKIRVELKSWKNE